MIIEHFNVVVGVIAGLVTIVSSIIYFATITKKMRDDNKAIKEGVKCMLRASMLNTYYKNTEKDEWRQYEAENFELQYKAYKALDGNSFIDNIHSEVSKWGVKR